MSTSVSSEPVQACCTRSLQLAFTIQLRRILILNSTIEQASVFSGLEPDLWSKLEAGFIPPLDNTLWIWWTLAGTLEVSVSKLFNLASVDLARNEMLAKKERILHLVLNPCVETQ